MTPTYSPVLSLGASTDIPHIYLLSTFTTFIQLSEHTGVMPIRMEHLSTTKILKSNSPGKMLPNTSTTKMVSSHFNKRVSILVQSFTIDTFPCLSKRILLIAPMKQLLVYDDGTISLENIATHMDFTFPHTKIKKWEMNHDGFKFGVDIPLCLQENQDICHLDLHSVLQKAFYENTSPNCYM
jgi:hypothetical protein